jgi:hypothetical protein
LAFAATMPIGIAFGSYSLRESLSNCRALCCIIVEKMDAGSFAGLIRYTDKLNLSRPQPYPPSPKCNPYCTKVQLMPIPDERTIVLNTHSDLAFRCPSCHPLFLQHGRPIQAVQYLISDDMLLVTCGSMLTNIHDKRSRPRVDQAGRLPRHLRGLTNGRSSGPGLCLGLRSYRRRPWHLFTITA